MPTSVARKPRTTTAKPAPRKPPANALLPLGVQQMTPLADGYAIVKLDTPGAPSKTTGKIRTTENPSALLAQHYPTIPAPTLRRILRVFAEDAPGIMPGIPPGRPAPDQKPAPPENIRFMAELKAQERRNRKRDVEEGRLLPGDEMAKRLQVSKQTLGRAVRDKRMFSIDGPGGIKVYPAFFADPRYNRVDLERVSRELGYLPGASKLQFFTTPKGSLNAKTPIEALAKGDLETVLKAAAGFREL